MNVSDFTSALCGLSNRLSRLTVKVNTLAKDLAKVNAKTQRAGTTIGPLLGSTDVTITWPEPFPDAQYAVLIETVTGTAALGNVHATLKAGTKTAEGCVVTVSTLLNVASIGIDVVGIRT